MSSQLSQDIRGVMIGVTGARVLLPNATVAEVITYSPPEAVDGAPDWMLGRIRWRGWRLPVISYARMIGSAREEGEFGAKVVVLKALGGNPRHSYFALLTQGFPRLVTVSQDALTQEDADQSIEGVLMNVRLRDEDAVIPDLAAIEARIAEIDSARAA